MPKDFKTKKKVRASAEDVYAALTNPFALELWTGFPAKMSTEPGSEFELWEGDICGRNIEFVENKLIRQEWYFGEQEEESIVSIWIQADSSNRSTLLITHTNIPDEAYDEITSGWEECYLDSLQLFLEEGDE